MKARGGGRGIKNEIKTFGERCEDEHVVHKARPPTTVLLRDQDYSYLTAPSRCTVHTTARYVRTIIIITIILYYIHVHTHTRARTQLCVYTVRVLVCAVGPPADTVNVFVDIARILYIRYSNDNIILLVSFPSPVRGFTSFFIFFFCRSPFSVSFLFSHSIQSHARRTPR